MHPSNQIAGQLTSIKKSNLSLAEALREIDLAKQSFDKISSLESTLVHQNLVINELKIQMQQLVPMTLFNARLDEMHHVVEKAVKAKFEEISVQVYKLLNDKLSTSEAETLLKQKVTWASHNNLSQEIGNIKSRLDKHIFSDFEGLKTKMKLELAQRQVRSDKEGGEFSSDEVLQLKSRISGIEQQLQELFAEEEDFEEDESYDSEEELDGMMDDLERTVLREKRAREAEANYAEEQEEVEETSKPQILMQSQIEEVPHLEANVQEQQPSQPQDVKPTEIQEIKPTQIEDAKTYQTQVTLVKEEEQKASEIKGEIKVLATKEERAPVNPFALPPKEERHPINPFAPIREENKSIMNIPPGLPLIAEGEGSPRNLKTRGSSKADGLGRMSSRASSIGKKLGGAGLSQINKKLAAMQKDIESNKKGIEDTQVMIGNLELEIQKIMHETIFDIKDQHKQLEEKTKTMESSFIKALRRKGINTDKKAEKKVVDIPRKEIDKLHRDIEDKFKRIVTVET